MIPTSRQLPGGAPVMGHSRFAAIEGAACPADLRPVAGDPGLRSSGRPRPVALDGEWRRRAAGDSTDFSGGESADSDWPTVRVPDSYGSEPGLSRHFGPVWYRRRIVLPHRGIEGFHDYLDLEFEAADYFCDVYLDGDHLGRHEGYFAPFGFDVTARANAGSLLAVKVQCPLEELDPNEYMILHRKRQVKGVLGYHDSRPGGLPGKTTPGWTPSLGQSMPTGGITRPVELRRTGPVRIDAVFATPLEKSLNIAVIATNRTSEAIDVRLDFEIDGMQSHAGAVTATLAPGANRADLESTIADAPAWSPPGHDHAGRAALCSLAVTTSIGGVVSDARRISFGFRSFSLETRSPQDWVFRLNQKPIAIRGANYIPTQHIAGIDSAWYMRDFDLAQEAGLNSLGLHAHQQPRPFYDAADRAGLLVFQDFSLQWNYESDESANPGFRDRAAKMIAEMAYTLWNHPSVVHWCCHNEPPYVWAPEAAPDQAGDLDNQVLDRILEDRLRAIDPIRPIARASGIGDAHKYEGSVAGGALGDFAATPAGFVTEFGFPAPGWAAARWGDPGWPPDAETLRQWAGRLSFFGTTSTYVGAPSRYSCPQDWIYACQRYGALLLKYQTETMRTWPRADFMVHMLTDWWGYAGSGLVDVTRTPKLAYKWFKDAMRPLIALVTYPRTVIAPGEAVSMPVWVASDKSHDTNALMVSWRLCKMRETEIITADPGAAVLGGSGIAAPEGHRVALPRGDGIVSELVSGRFYAPVNAASAVMAGEISFTTPPDDPCAYTIFLDWENPLGESGHNWFHFAVAGEPTPPGLSPPPRFKLAVAVGEPGMRSKVSLRRKFRRSDGDLVAETGDGGIARFDGLPPDCYEVSSSAAPVPITVELWGDTSIELS